MPEPMEDAGSAIPLDAPIEPATAVLCTALGPFNSFDALPPDYVGGVDVCTNCVPVDSGDCDPDSAAWCCGLK